MARKRLMKRFAVLVVMLFSSLMLAAMAGLLLPASRTEAGPTRNGVTLGAQRELAGPGAPFQLSERPGLYLRRGSLSSDAGSSNQPGGSKGGARLVLDAPVFVLDAGGQLREAPGEAAPLRKPQNAMAMIGPLFDQLTSFGFEALAIRRGTLIVTWADGEEHLTEIDAEVTGPRRGLSEQLTATGAATLRGQRLEFSAALSPAKPGRDPSRDGANVSAALPRDMLTLSVKAPFLSAQFEGRVDFDGPLAVSGPIEITLPKFGQFVRWLGISHFPAGVIDEADARGTLRWQRGVVHIDRLSARLDAQKASGALSFGFSGNRPRVEGTLAFPGLDVSPYVAASLPKSIDLADLDQNWREVATASPLIREIDADLRISAALATFKKTNLGPLAATLITRQGRLDADIPQLEVGGVKGSLQVSIDMTNGKPRTHIRSRFEAADAAPFARAALGSETLSGRIAAQVDLVGAGETLGAVFQSANGKVTLNGLPGLRVPLDPKGLRVEALKSATPLPKTGAPNSPGWGQAARKPVPLDALDARLLISNGSILIDTIRAASAGQIAQITGRANLSARTADLSVSLSAGEHLPASVKSTRAMIPSSDGSEPIQITGPFNAPTIRFDRPREKQ